MVSYFYLFCFIFACVLSMQYVYKWNEHYNEHVTLLFMIVPLANYGFWDLSVAKNIEQAVLANKITKTSHTEKVCRTLKIQQCRQ